MITRNKNANKMIARKHGLALDDKFIKFLGLYVMFAHILCFTVYFKINVV